MFLLVNQAASCPLKLVGSCYIQDTVSGYRMRLFDQLDTQEMRTMKRITTTWEIATYDVWGNARDGYEVNDVYRHGETTLVLTVNTYNQGTPQEFESASPTDRQLRRVFGLGKVQIDTDGDDLHIYVNRARDSYPIGELHCTSHKSLSPIQPTTNPA